MPLSPCVLQHLGHDLFWQQAWQSVGWPVTTVSSPSPDTSQEQALLEQVDKQDSLSAKGVIAQEQ